MAQPIHCAMDRERDHALRRPHDADHRAQFPHLRRRCEQRRPQGAHRSNLTAILGRYSRPFSTVASCPRRSGTAVPEKDRRRRARGEGDHQAAGETLSAILTPSTAAGGADGERWTEWPAAIAAVTSASSTRCSSSRSRPSAAMRGARWATGSLGHDTHLAAEYESEAAY